MNNPFHAIVFYSLVDIGTKRLGPKYFYREIHKVNLNTLKWLFYNNKLYRSFSNSRRWHNIDYVFQNNLANILLSYPVIAFLKELIGFLDSW
jgi:hypothetical protein